jgi:hypothetical protein
MSTQDVFLSAEGMCRSWTSVHQGQNLVGVVVAEVLIAAGLEAVGVVCMLVVVALWTQVVTVTLVVNLTTTVSVLEKEGVAVEVIVGLIGGGLGAGEACTPIAMTRQAKIVNLESSRHNMVWL